MAIRAVAGRRVAGVGATMTVNNRRAATGGDAPSNTAAPAVTLSTGNGQVSSVLSTSDGTWTNTPTSYTYQWQTSSNGTTFTDASGATSSTFTVPTGAVAARCQVTATNASGSTAATSAAYVVAPSVTSVSAIATGTTSTLTANSQTVNTGDIAVVVISCFGDVTPITPPSGWVLIGEASSTSGTSDTRIEAYYHLGTPTSWDFTQSGTTRWSIVSMIVSGVHQTSPLDGTALAVGSTSGVTTHNITGTLTTGQSNSLAAIMCGSRFTSAHTWSTYTGGSLTWTEHFDVGNTAAPFMVAAAATAPDATPGAINNFAATVSSSTRVAAIAAAFRSAGAA